MRRGFLTVSLVLFVLFDIGLVVLAVRHVQSQTADGAASDASTGTQGDRSSEGPSDDATSRGTPDPAREDDPVMLPVADDGTILRALEGDCAVGPDASVSLSADGGASFEPLALEVAQVLRLSTPAAGVLAVIGADDDCAVRTYTSNDGGDSWATSSAGEEWYPDPGGRRVIHSPQGDAEAACDVRFLHPIDSTVARVTCRDGQLQGTADTGEDWMILGRLPGARAVVYESPGDGFALARADGCAAQSYATIDGGREWERTGCISAEGIQGIAFNDATMVAQVGDEIFQSTDDGQTWSQPWSSPGRARDRRSSDLRPGRASGA